MQKFTKIKMRNGQRGVTYVELIVVLSIFAIMSGVVIYNYGAFQSKVDIKNLASDVALKIVDAQKTALSGKQTTKSLQSPGSWKPAYGVYFKLATPNKFLSFVDLDNPPQDKIFNSTDCTGECLETTTITKNDFISDIAFNDGTTTTCGKTDLGIVFSRPGSDAVFSSANAVVPNLAFVQIKVSAPTSGANTVCSPVSGVPSSIITIYPSGRIQIN